VRRGAQPGDEQRRGRVADELQDLARARHGQRAARRHEQVIGGDEADQRGGERRPEAAEPRRHGDRAVDEDRGRRVAEPGIEGRARAHGESDGDDGDEVGKPAGAQGGPILA